MKCKTCGAERHYCSSCDMDVYMSNDYCDRECFIKSDYYKKEKEAFEALLDRLDKDAIRCIKQILSNADYLLENDYLSWIDNRLKE